MAITTVHNELIAVNAISGTAIADNAVTSVHIAKNNIGTVQIAQNSVTSVSIAENNVTGTQIAMNAVTSTQLADNAVTATKIPDGTQLALGATTFSDDVAINNSSPELYFGTTGDHYNWRVAAQENVDAAFTIDVGSQDTAYGNDTYSSLFTLKNTGNVGIGITNPATTLHLDSSGGAVLRMQRTSSNASNKLELSHDGTDATITSTNELFLTATKVGVGTTSLNAKLDVVATSGEIFRADGNNGAYRIVANQTGVMMNGNVGIGTTSPSYKLHQSGTGLQRFQMDSTDNNQYGCGIYLRVLNSGSVVSQSTTAIDNAGNLKFFTGTSNEAERMRIDSSGRVGIGATSPTHLLETAGDSTWDNIHFKSNYTVGSGLSLDATNGGGSWSIISNGGGGGAGAGNLGVHLTSSTLGGVSSGYKFLISDDAKLGLGNTVGNFATGGYGAHPLYVQTGVSNGTVATDAFAHVGPPVGLTNANTDGYISGISLGYHENNTSYKHSAIGVRSHGDGAARRDMIFLVNSVFEAASASLSDAKLTISSGNGTVSGDLNDTSDEGFKKDIKSLGSTLDLVKQLKPRTFTWKGRKAARGDSVGFIAQEVKEVIKDNTIVQGDAYEKDGDTGLSINTIGLVSYLTKAIQEQQEQIEALKAEVDKLKG